MSRNWFHKLVFFLAIIVYLITAYNSHGYYHADEHYQIIEFAGLKLGTHSPADVAWEYKSQIRSTLQPIICFAVFKGLQTIHVTDPYTQAFVLRILSALLSLLVIHYFITNTENQLGTDRIKKLFYLLSYFLWFIPFISVRFSSETWSGLFFLGSVAVYFDPKRKGIKPYLIGLLAGFSFLFRFQAAFLIPGFLLWLFFIEKNDFRFILKIGAAFLMVFGVGILIDSWFYGQPVLTAWNYFYTNIVSDVASNFGTSAWYFYLDKLFQLPTLFIGELLFISMIIVVIKNPRNPYLWCILPFILVHSFIPHKEERFLFPIVYFFPIIMVLAYSAITDYIKTSKIVRGIGLLVLLIFGSINMTGLIAMSQKSAGIGRIGITKYIHDHDHDRPINLIYCNYANPYNPWNSIPEKFYLEKDIQFRKIDRLNELNDSLIVANDVNLLVVRKINLEGDRFDSILGQFGFVQKKQSIPEWIAWLNKFCKGMDTKDILVLYKLDSAELQPE